MTFLSPNWLWLLPLLLPILVWRRRRAWRSSFASESLRLAAVTLLVLALAGLRGPAPHGPETIHVYLADASGSVLAASGADREDALNRIARRIAEAAGPEDEGARLLVMFGANALVAGPEVRGRRDHWAERLPTLVKGAIPDPAETDIEGALRTALAAIPPGAGGEIVVFTDGRATRGDARRAVEEAGRRRIQVRTAATGAPPPDAMIRSVRAPMEATEEESIPIDIVSAATTPLSARLEVRRLNRVLWSEEIGLDAEVENTRRVLIPPTGPESGVYEARITPASGHDAAPENDTWAFAVAPRSVRSVAVIGESRAAVADTLARTDGVRVLSDGSWEETALADVVVLAGASLDGVARERMEGLAGRVQSGAAGLIVLGGPHAYALGGYSDSPLDRLLPVSPAPAADLALGVLLDCSGSMNEPASDGRPKIQAAKEAVRGAVLTLGPGDRVGLTGFADAPREVLPLQPRPAAGRLDQALGEVVAGGPTRLAAPLRAMRELLNGATAARKHLVILSDGQTADPIDDLRNAVGALASAAISTTVFAVGPKIDEERLRLVCIGEGSRLRRLSGYRDLATALEEDLAEARELVKTGRTSPIAASSGGSVAGIGSWPEVTRFHRTTLRPHGTLLLRSPEGDPLAAEGPAGLGRCLAVTWALHPAWTPGLTTWREARRFLQQAVESVSPPRPSADVSLTTAFTGDVLRVHCALKRDPARLVAPDLRYEVWCGEKPLSQGNLTSDGPDSAGAEFSRLPAGLLTIVVRPAESMGMDWRATRSIPRPYATEWSALGPDRSALAALETGSPVDRPAGSPSPAGPDLRPWLSGFALAAAIGAVALDAAKRREGSRR